MHIRTIYSAIIDNKVEPLLSNLLKLLKPGGYLQWDESDASALHVQVPQASLKADATIQLVKIQALFSAQNKLYPNWLHDLGSTLQAAECEVIAHDEFEPRHDLSRAWNDNMLLVWTGVTSLVPEIEIPLPPGMGLPQTISRDSYARLLAEAVNETSKGAFIGMPYHVFVVRKSV